MKRRVLFIIHSMSYGGGAERVLANLINGLYARGGYDISLLEVHHSDIAWEQLPEDVHLLPAVIDETATGFTRRAYRWFIRRALDKVPYCVRNYVRGSNRFDLVVAFNYLVPTYLVYEDEPSIAWNHGSIEDLSDKPRDRERLRKSLLHFNRIVAIAKRTERSILDLYPEYVNKLNLIYNGFEFEGVRAKAKEPLAQPLAPIFLVAVGRLDENKNPLRILRAFTMLRKSFPNVHLYYLGDGDLRDELKGSIDEGGLLDCVHLLGHVSNPYPYISQAASLISLSSSEGFQTVIVESLALGVPFISTPVGAAEELSCNGEHGFILHEDENIAEAFGWALRSRNDAMAANARKNFVQKFTLDNQVSAFLRLADDVCEEGAMSHE